MNEKPTIILELEKQLNVTIDSYTLNEAGELIGLDLIAKELTDISPLAGLVHLSNLNLGFNQISNIDPLSGLVHLSELNLNANRIRDISLLSRFVSLSSLDLSFNQISNIRPLSGLVQLSRLYLHENQISDISPLSGLVELSSLDLTYNKIRDISPLSSLVQLSHLELNENQISDISPLSSLIGLLELSLYYNQINDISPLSGLIKLSNLNLSINLINDISSLAGLVQLSHLELRRNQISDISPLSGLVKLSTLSLSSNQISDISPLSGIVQLSRLELGENQIHDVSPLSGLVQLSRLELGTNQIRDVSPLSGLVQLSYLELSDNKINDISPLSGLVQLSRLDLSDNQINDISFLSGLVNLYSLDLSYNQISDISSVIEVLEKSKVKEVVFDRKFYYNKLKLFANPLPREVIDAIKSGGKEGLLKYVEAQQRGRVRIPEAKMVLLGEPRAGKTTLQKYLMGLPINENEPSTPDIQISVWRPFGADEVDEHTRSIKINLWDFGGQEIQYSLHKLFMTEDTLYVIVLDSTKDQSPTPYLKFLENYAPRSPFIILNNYGDVGTSNTAKLDENYLRETYQGQDGKPILKGIFKRVSVLKAAQLDPSYRKIMDEVEATIKQELLQLQNLNEEFPREYLSVKTAIEAEYSQPNKHYITMTYYRELCRSLDVTDDEWLRKAILAYLNEIGVLRYFKDTPSAYHILNPQWLIDGAYSLMMDELTGLNQGVLRKPDACGILKRSRKGFQFHEDEAEFIFTTMKYYGLLYADEVEQKVYIPLRFSSLQPTTLTDFYEKGQHFYFEFKSDIPEDVIAYLIVKHFEEISSRIYWSKGAIFERDQVRILAKVEDRSIHFYIQGQYHQLYFERLRKTLHDKLATLQGLGYEEMVEFSYQGKKITALYEDLVNTLKDNWGDYRDYATRTKVPETEIVRILGGYFSERQIQQITNQYNYLFYGDYNDNRFQHITIIQELKSLVQLAQHPDDKRALEAIKAEIQQWSQAKGPSKKVSLGKRVLEKIKQLSTDTLDDAVKDKLKELFPQVIENGMDWIRSLDIEGIMQTLGGII